MTFDAQKEIESLKEVNRQQHSLIARLAIVVERMDARLTEAENRVQRLTRMNVALVESINWNKLLERTEAKPEPKPAKQIALPSVADVAAVKRTVMPSVSAAPTASTYRDDAERRDRFKQREKELQETRK